MDTSRGALLRAAGFGVLMFLLDWSGHSYKRFDWLSWGQARPLSQVWWHLPFFAVFGYTLIKGQQARSERLRAEREDREDAERPITLGLSPADEHNQKNKSA